MVTPISRLAFTMIELIYAIVIIGISFVILPIIIMSNSQNLEQNLEQEALFLASTKVNHILTFGWDENSRNPASSVLSKAEALDVADGDDEFDRSSANSDFRIGHFEEALHRRMTPHFTPRTATPVAALAMEVSDAGTPDDIDDFNLIVDTSIGTGSQYGYKSAYDLTSCVDYVTDVNNYTATALSMVFETSTDCVYGTTASINDESNIKMVQVAVDKLKRDGSVENNIIVLRSYAANIGETDYYKRTYE